MSDVVYRSQSRIERVRGPIRNAYIPGEEEHVVFGVHGAIAEHYGEPERFFSRHFVANYCPLVFMAESGRNLTPDKLPAHERTPLYAACDRFLQRLVLALEPTWVIGVGAFAASRAGQALHQEPVRLWTILHPSPANPRANRDWAGEVETQLRQLGVCDCGTAKPG